MASAPDVDITPPSVYFNRRALLKGGLLAASAAATAGLYRVLNGVGHEATETKKLASLVVPPDDGASGFRVEGDELFHPIRLDPAILADAYPDTLADALEPVDEALAHLAAALPEFNRLIEAAQSHFGRQAIEATPPG